ncbi:acyl-CoA dehydrogenase [Desulfoluna butyratoxydans]|uniref:Acyl-coa dehydrogenase/oxidase c-terminal n=1 Tax=Desulfoluna butyratoxydans TaxID=231438 RepID=A0A4U8YPK9_9BACT|nr:acyl-CoA dehydrogenase [Desulfoluna butyratoxydans]VFQ45721.1 acyl-coa dehydrogenase/oxidase c-terminal [Desulfoluna butyratoxydans]
MAQPIADRRDVDFVLHEQMEVTRLTDNETFAEFNKKTIDMIVSEARSLAIKEIMPTQEPGDAGCDFEGGTVTLPECYSRPWELFIEGEWLAMSDSPEWGGQGMPKTVALAANEYFIGANVAFMLYHGLTHGAAKMVEEIGNEKQKKLYLKKLYSGEWAGTMLLTEACAGSDVGALETTAKKNPDGTYSITGSKIFISGGEHSMTPNIVHPVLARIEGAPAGTRGISLFLVPKYRVNDDGSLGEFNDVVCTGIEHKMGINGSATCSLTLGGSGNCIGELLGEENKGMRNMFIMMNDARQLVGLQGFGVATASYMHALAYARERVQGANMVKPREGSVPIIQHPDVRRQLLEMKANVEGMRSLIYFSGICHDMVKLAEDEETRLEYSQLLEVLTPIIKGYVTDKANEVCSHGVQVYGGYGYCKDFPVEQLLRDSRIFQIYEGTNGIQSMDLLGRKVGMSKGKPFMSFLARIKKTIDEAKESAELKPLAAKLEEVYTRFNEVVVALANAAMGEKVQSAFAQSHPLLTVTGDLTFGWLLLWRALTAEKALAGKPKKKDLPFYEGQIKTCAYYINNTLAVTLGRLAAIEGMDDAVIGISEEGFGSK